MIIVTDIIPLEIFTVKYEVIKFFKTAQTIREIKFLENS